MMREALLLVLEGLTPFADAWALLGWLYAARQQGIISDVVILLEHQPVLTIGRSGGPGHLLVPRDLLAERGVEVHDIERGGGAASPGSGWERRRSPLWAWR